MPAQRIVSRAQMEILISFMNQHRDFANCKIQAKRQSSMLWDELATLLSNVRDGGTKKSGELWRRYWAERKYHVRKKAKDIQRAVSSGKPPRMKLTEEEMKIYDVIGRMSDKAEPCSMIPFPEEDSSQSGPSDPLSSFDKFLTDETPQKEPVAIQEYKEPRQQLESKPAILNHIQLSANEDTDPDPTNPLEGPPQWAIDIEERRVAATERIAASLELLTSAVVGMHQSLQTLTQDVATIKEVLVSRPP